MKPRDATWTRSLTLSSMDSSICTKSLCKWPVAGKRTFKMASLCSIGFSFQCVYASWAFKWPQLNCSKIRGKELRVSLTALIAGRRVGVQVFLAWDWVLRVKGWAGIHSWSLSTAFDYLIPTSCLLMCCDVQSWLRVLCLWSIGSHRFKDCLVQEYGLVFEGGVIWRWSVVRRWENWLMKLGEQLWYQREMCLSYSGVCKGILYSGLIKGYIIGWWSMWGAEL